MGRGPQPESIGVALDVEQGGLMSRLDIVQCHSL